LKKSVDKFGVQTNWCFPEVAIK